ncbi:MAG: [acyl-carrier-protein] S-malonyltransferase [Candidatus Omnitrophica bacterium CG12_big_fil_rev_8_21_14_0_65_50_5]|nr:MAG: [acyl-carrier-protein] S-malonyltransferase [Candidatus Omnitrophica bacterium CG12_big_fil_rev_8_21_14_0_65_50_5]
MKQIALVFPGQGAQKIGMGRELYEASAEARAVIDEADGVIKDLKTVMFNGPQDVLTTTAFCQPAIFTHSLAGLKALQASGQLANVEVAFTCGLSLGEYSAIAACGVLSLNEALRLIRKRGAYMDEACKLKAGAMAAVIGFEEEALKEICRQTGAEIANFNSPSQIVITGEKAKVEVACTMLKEKGAKRVISLDVAGAFHSSLMKPAADRFAADLAQVHFSDGQFPVVGNVDGLPSQKADDIRAKLGLQITSSVQWIKSIQTISAQGVDTFLEIGPGTVLKGLIRQINPALTVHTIQTPGDVGQLSL